MKTRFAWHSMHWVLGIILAGLAHTASAASVNFITNGNFDTAVPSNGTGGGWTSSNIDGSGGHFTNSGQGGSTFTNYFVLNQAGQFATDPTLEQVVGGLTVGSQYLLTGDFEGVFTSFGNPNVNSFGVDIVALQLQEFMRPNGVGSFGFIFVATSIQHTLRLTGERNGDDSSYAVDNLSITLANSSVAVPEPSILGLFGAGLLGLLVFRRKRAVKHASNPL